MLDTFSKDIIYKKLPHPYTQTLFVDLQQNDKSYVRKKAWPSFINKGRTACFATAIISRSNCIPSTPESSQSLIL